MIKFDRDVHGALKNLEKEGFETYAAGECVRDQILGTKVYDWDLLTRADLAKLQEIFPKGEVISKKEQILRVDFTYEVQPKDPDDPVVIEGCIVDIRHFEGSIEEAVSQNGFTVNAMADNPQRGFIDQYGGREDIRAKLIRTTGDADELFRREPIRMLEAVRLAAELGFDLHKTVYEAIGRNWRLLLDKMENGSIAPVREEFEQLMVSAHAGKGLKMLAGTGLMPVILGEEVAAKMSMSDMNSFNTVCDNIDKTKQVRTRRLGILYTALSTKRALSAIERMEFDEKTKTHLIDGVKDIIDIQFLNDDKSFKKYLYEHGLERYNYVHNLSKALRIIYDQPTLKIESRNYMMKKITSNNEPVFVEDLVIDANDIMEAGIADTPEKAEALLDMIIAIVHKDPRNNKRDVLLKQAKKYSRNKLAAKTRYVRWVR